MIWKVKISDTALKQLKKLDNKSGKTIIDYLETRIETDKDPCRFGGALRHSLAGLWKYRIGEYRVICKIQKKKVLVLVLRVGHRKDILRRDRRGDLL